MCVAGETPTVFRSFNSENHLETGRPKGGFPVFPLLWCRSDIKESSWFLKIRLYYRKHTGRSSKKEQINTFTVRLRQPEPNPVCLKPN